MFSGNVYYRGDKTAAEDVLHEATQLANLASTKKVALGVPNFREQFTLSSGATLDVVLGEHTSFITIVGSGGEAVEERVIEEEEEEGAEGLFIVRPKAGYPQAVIYKDAEVADGIGLRWGDDIVAGNYYTQGKQNNGMILSVSMDNSGFYFLEGSRASEKCSTQFFAGGYLLMETDLPSEKAIGAAIVDGSMFCFVVNEGVSIQFYSHPLVKIDYSATDFVTPLVNFSDCTLAHSIAFKTYDSVNAYTTPCTFSIDGSKAVVAALLGQKNIGADRYSKQDIWKVALSVVEATLVVSDSYQSKTHSYRETKYSNGAVYQGTASSTTLWVGDIDYLKTVSQYWAGELVNNIDIAFDDARVFFSAVIGDSGLVVNSVYVYEEYSHKSGTPAVIVIPSAGSVGFKYGSATQTETKSNLDQVQAIIEGQSPNLVGMLLSGESVLAKNNVVPVRSGHFTYDKVSSQQYEFSWQMQEATNKATSNPTHDNFVTGLGFSAPYLLSVERFEEYNPPSDTTTYFIRAKPPHLAATPFPYGTISGVADSKIEEKYVIEFSMRQNISLVGHKKTPTQTATLSFVSAGNDTTWGAADYSVHGDCYISFDSIFSSVDVPGLLAKHGDVDDNIDSVTRTDKYVNAAGFVPGVGDRQRNTAPYKVDSSPSITGDVYSHPKGYALYSMTDYFVQQNEDNYDASYPVTTVLAVYNSKTNKHIDVLKKYNELLMADSRVSHLGELAAKRTGNPQYYIETAGVINTIPIPTLNASLY